MSLPSGYTQLEYIQSTGAQYINTGIAAKSTLRVQIKFCLSEVQGYSVIGYYNSESDSFRLFNASEKCYLDFGNSYEGNGRIYGGSLATNATHEVEFGNLYVKDLATGGNIISGTAVSAFTKSTSIFLCGNSNYAKGKFYYLKIYDGSTLLLDMVPCKNASGTAGMYDKVSSQFYAPGAGAFTAGPVALPEQPQGLSYTVEDGVVSLTWSASELATGYKISRDGTQVSDQTGTSFTETVEKGKTYTYTVNAYNSGGSSSASTVKVEVPKTAPDAPANLHQVLQVKLAWTAVECEGYHVYRDGMLLGSTTDTWFVDDTAVANMVYTYSVAAYNGSLESDPVTLQVDTREGYAVIRPVVSSAFFQ